MTGWSASAAFSDRDTDLRGLYTFGAVLLYLLAVLPLMWATVVHPMPAVQAQTVVFFLLLASGFLGYGAQIVGSHIFRIEPPRDDTGRDGLTKKRYRLHLAIAVHLAAIALFYLSGHLGAALMERYGTDTYTRDSAVPSMLGLYAAIMCEVGGYLWFYPYRSLIHIRRAKLLFVVGGLNFYMLFTMGFTTGTSGFYECNMVLLVFCIVLYMLLLNQEHITYKYRGVVICGVNDRAKRHSVQIVLTATLFLILGTAGGMCVIVAIASLGTLILKTIVASRAQDSEEVRQIYDEELVEDVLRMRNGSSEGWLAGFYIFAVICIIIGVMILSPVLREKLKALLAYLQELLRFLLRGERRTRKKPEQVEVLNYVDTVESTRSAKKKQDGPSVAVRTYADFRRSFDTLETEEARVRYAYAVVVGLLRHKKCGIRICDTPRELTRKVKTHDLVSDMEALTRDYEAVGYGERSSPTQGATLTRLCTLVGLYLD